MAILDVGVTVKPGLLRELGGLGHLTPQHELRSLQGDILPLVQEFETIVDDSSGSRCQGPTMGIRREEAILVQENTPPAQEVPAMANNLDSSLGVVAV